MIDESEVEKNKIYNVNIIIINLLTNHKLKPNNHILSLKDNSTTIKRY